MTTTTELRALATCGACASCRALLSAADEIERLRRRYEPISEALGTYLADYAADPQGLARATAAVLNVAGGGAQPSVERSGSRVGAVGRRDARDVAPGGVVVSRDELGRRGELLVAVCVASIAATPVLCLVLVIAGVR